MKKLLETISKQQGTDNQEPTTAKRTSIRQSPTTTTTYEHVCIFCEKKSKYKKSGTLGTIQRFACRSLNSKISNEKEGQQDSRNCVP